MSLSSLFRRRRFTRLESALLAKVQESLPSQSAAIFQQQLHSITSIRRMAGYREVLCYRKTAKDARDSFTPAFPANRAELRFCTIHFSVNGLTRAWTAEFLLVKGYFFSIAFTPSVKEIKDRNDVRINKVDLLADLTVRTPKRSTQTTPVSRSTANLPDWVTDLEKMFEVRHLYSPLSEDLRMEIQKEIDAALPADYLKLVGMVEGLEVGNMSILGMSQVYEVVLPDWNYYLIGELHSIGALGVRKHGRDAEIYLLDYGGGAPRRMGTSLQDAVRTLLAEKEH